MRALAGLFYCIPKNYTTWSNSEDTAVKLLLPLLFNKYIFLSQQFDGIAKIR